ncbi:Asp23/Gls24 family envelope stress response protein [Anaerococcus hydrogenalis]|uniref:Alkaline shock protein 23 n=2 Tax=Anaerococcus hydrogenalis TaxID=33029 RepID=F0GZW3_9FIRM|nr:Asp23/Gls24 family envelope stress response protein [Anaerococcus hydrogenalis]EGC84189.1 alkaline shock protein 23 [Anaerococcus hydrogenalis ACS-025-V-Sch4]MBS5988735.1 Asp23/Gls24 family envelope stress response protein [Anaerococcus hydrogenalis]MDK7695722.1 Asp23/Gls24 family envelope stress response protein [Anaerococcus hydrogenalis]MDK7697455.1 Asp23/Gls24 family envelope stress response protein [Anaerococcus hydrogenalis]MDK7708722.1 Asp23/Gls24 family envelope stress response prot
MTEKTFDKEYEKGLEKDAEIEQEVSKLSIADKVVAKISRIAVNRVDGILDMKASFFDSVSSVFQSSTEQDTSGVDVEVGEKEAKVNMQIILEYGKSAPRIFEQIKKVVRENVKEMTGLNVITVNVDVVDVMTREEYKAKKSDSDDKKDRR